MVIICSDGFEAITVAYIIYSYVYGLVFCRNIDATFQVTAIS